MAAADDALEQFLNSLDQLNGAVSTAASSLRSAGTATSASTRATQSFTNASQAATAAQNRAAGALNQFGSGISGTIAGIVKLTQSTVNLANAGTDASSSLSAIGGLFGSITGIAKNLIDVAAGLAKAVPGVGLFTSNIADGLSVAAKAALDFGTSLIDINVKLVAGQLKSYKDLAQTGAIFGGSLSMATAAAHGAGVSLNTYSSFITKNADKLSLFTGSIETGAATIMRSTRSMGDGLAAMYGGFDELAGEVADYVALQTLVGTNAVRDQDALTAGAKEYLLNQKMLSDLTGKNAKALKADQEARAKDAAYQAAIGDMSVKKRQATEAMVEMITSRYGKQAGEMAQEAVARGGDIISKGGLKFLAMMPDLGNMIITTMSNVGEDVAAAQSRFAQDAERLAPVVKEYQTQFRDLFALQSAGYLKSNELINIMATTVNTSVSTLSQQENAVSAMNAAVNSLRQAIAKPPDLADAAVRAMENIKIKLDEAANAAFLQMPAILKFNEAVVTKLIDGLTKLNDIIGFIIKGDYEGLANYFKSPSGPIVPYEPITDTPESTVTQLGGELSGAEIMGWENAPSISKSNPIAIPTIPNAKSVLVPINSFMNEWTKTQAQAREIEARSKRNENVTPAETIELRNSIDKLLKTTVDAREKDVELYERMISELQASREHLRQIKNKD